MTKYRITGVLLCVFYIAAACFFGLQHDHHDHNTHQHCTACEWAVSAVADVAVPTVVPALADAVACFLVLSSDVVIVAPVLCSTASRAPPLASA